MECRQLDVFLTVTILAGLRGSNGALAAQRRALQTQHQPLQGLRHGLQRTPRDASHLLPAREAWRQQLGGLQRTWLPATVPCLKQCSRGWP